MARALLVAAACLALSGCAPARFRADWEDSPKEGALVYGRVKMPDSEGAPRLISVYQMFHPMLGWKGLGDPGVYDDGSFVVCDLSPGDKYFVQGFWLEDELYVDLAERIKQFSLKAGEMKYVGSWKVTNFKKRLMMTPTFKLARMDDADRAKVLKTFLADPKVREGPWAKRVKAELATLQ